MLLCELRGTVLRKIAAHKSKVCSLDIDVAGQALASCSADCTVVISTVAAAQGESHGETASHLFTSELSSTRFNYHRPVESVRLDPA